MPDPKKPESASLRNHRRQFVLQILLPFLVMAGLIIAGAVLAVTGGPLQTGAWADVSLIWLIAPWLGFALLVAGLLGLLIYGLARLTRLTPRYTGRAQEIATAVSAGTRRMADRVAKPIMWLQQAGATLESLASRLTGRGR